jgi:hypothetical protein
LKIFYFNILELLVINRAIAFNNQIQIFLKEAVERSKKKEFAQAAAEVVGFF